MKSTLRPRKKKRLNGNMRYADGILMKIVGGFYYVRCNEEDFECKARGSFRQSGVTPLVGDSVHVSVPDEGYCVLEKVYFPRQNELKRPPLANIDLLIIVCSTIDPSPNYLVIDKMIASAVSKNIEPVIVISKNDLKNGDEIAKIYRNSGIKVFQYSPCDMSEIKDLRAYMSNKTSAFSGNSGVGKSTLINALFPKLSLQTGEISKKLGRGRHTTRTVELFEIDNCFVADTPGFSSVDLQRYEMIDKDRLAYCFPDFEYYLGCCKYASCSHTCEDGCRILQAVADGDIEKTRHQSYVAMYNEVKDIKKWKLKQT